MSTIDFGAIADHVRELEDALDATQRQIEALWLAGRGAASMVPHEGDAVADMISDIYACDGGGLPKARELQKKLAEIVKDVTAP
jgi:hypothetical protein